MANRIHLSPPDVGQEERAALLRAFDSGWIAPVGPDLERFEHETAAYVGVRAAAALSSGTAALHLAMIILGVGPGDEVLVPTLTFAATANAVRYVSAAPVFVDVGASWTIDPHLVADYLRTSSARGKLPKAVITVDLFGQSADYAALRLVCEPYGVPIVQDAAEALGAVFRGEPVGKQGVMAALSFNGNKIITTGGGGMLLSDREDWIVRARFLATQARDPAPHYEHSTLGYNYRMSNVLASIGRAQLAKIEGRVARRRAVFAHYVQALSELEGWSFMEECPWGISNRWLTVALIEPGQARADRDSVRTGLERLDIESRPVWKPLHLQPVFSSCRAIGGENASRLFERGLCLPSGSSMRTEDVARVAESIRGICQSG